MVSQLRRDLSSAVYECDERNVFRGVSRLCYVRELEQTSENLSPEVKTKQGLNYTRRVETVGNTRAVKKTGEVITRGEHRRKW